MNKFFLSLLVLSLLCVSKTKAETVLFSSVIVYDEENKNIKSKIDPSEKIYSLLSNQLADGIVKVKLLNSEKAGEVYTILDANRICESEKESYILFGYVQKNENNWFGNIKLYNNNLKKVSRQFFAGDEINAYERFINTLSKNILNGIEEEMGIKVKSEEESDIRALEVKIPFSAFYWTPVDSDWSDKMLGIAGGNLGVELYPPIKKIMLRQASLDFSARLLFCYSYAKEQENSYPLTYHGISVGFPIICHLNFNKYHSFYLGSGPYCEFELAAIKPKYEDEKFHYQNLYGIEVLCGYELYMNKLLSIFSETGFNFHMNKDGFVSFRQSLGAKFSIFRSEKWKK